MVYEFRLDKINNKDFLPKCSTCIQLQTGYRAEMIEKPMIIDETLIEGDIESYDYKKLDIEINHLKILYPAIYVKENNNLFFHDYQTAIILITVVTVLHLKKGFNFSKNRLVYFCCTYLSFIYDILISRDIFKM